ncbi:ABC transporter substrate-binding protein [Nocardioides humi]|uniref:ABC transporter substrate-binding protein n=1 Tax=Nocardioides humi TaxID=449461 RepID=A0ABN2BQD4_9ACTN|nr:ABC transporter substrate-binding protein [Nocardioides humi]
MELLRLHRGFGAALAVGVLVVTGCGAPGGSGGTSELSDAESAAAKNLGIDLDDCPAGVTDEVEGTVKVGQTLPLSGPIASALSPIGAGVQVRFEVANESGAYEHDFELVQKDDQFAPDKALVASRELVAKDQPVAFTSQVGTPQVLAVRDVMEETCTPLIPAVSNGVSANSPDSHPWTAVVTLPSAVDVRAWKDHVVETHPDGAKVAFLYSNDASGEDYRAAVERELEGTDLELVATESVEITETAAPASQITTLRSSGADVMFLAPQASQCTPALTEMASQGWHPDIYVTASCPTLALDQAGQAADGVYYNRYLKDPLRAPDNNDPDVLAWLDNMKRYEPGAPINQTSLAGYVDAAVFFAAVDDALDSELGLSRLGLIVAAAHVDFQSELMPDGVKIQLDGLDDQVAIESTLMAKYDASTKILDDVKLYDYQGQMTGVASHG